MAKPKSILFFSKAHKDANREKSRSPRGSTTSTFAPRRTPTLLTSVKNCPAYSRPALRKPSSSVSMVRTRTCASHSSELIARELRELNCPPVHVPQHELPRPGYAARLSPRRGSLL